MELSIKFDYSHWLSMISIIKELIQLLQLTWRVWGLLVGRETHMDKKCNGHSASQLVIRYVRKSNNIFYDIFRDDIVGFLPLSEVSSHEKLMMFGAYHSSWCGRVIKFVYVNLVSIKSTALIYGQYKVN